MAFRLVGLPIAKFEPLFGQPDVELREAGILRILHLHDARRGCYACRVAGREPLTCPRHRHVG